MTEIDQSMIDQLVAAAEEDTPESKIAKLEKEVETLKGSIKKLLIDIRETLNNLENPFQSLQNLAEVINKPVQPQQVQIIPTPPPKEEEEKKEEKEEKRQEEVKEVEDVGVKEEVVDNLIQVPVSELKPEKVKEVMPKGRIGITTLYNMMEWAKTMLEKYDVNTLKEILDLFESAGYISPELKEFTMKIVEIVGIVGNGLNELLMDIYKLHKTVNPNDKSMDSELLRIILEKKGV